MLLRNVFNKNIEEIRVNIKVCTKHGLEVVKLEFILRHKIKHKDWLLATRVHKQTIIALYFESETELKFYNLEAWSSGKADFTDFGKVYGSHNETCKILFASFTHCFMFTIKLRDKRLFIFLSLNWKKIDVMGTVLLKMQNNMTIISFIETGKITVIIESLMA